MTLQLFSYIMSDHKNCMTSHVMTLWHLHVIGSIGVYNTSLIEILFILKTMKSHFKGSYDKQKLTLVVVSYEIYETLHRLVS